MLYESLTSDQIEAIVSEIAGRFQFAANLAIDVDAETSQAWVWFTATTNYSRDCVAVFHEAGLPVELRPIRFNQAGVPVELEGELLFSVGDRYCFELFVQEIAEAISLAG